MVRPSWSKCAFFRSSPHPRGDGPPRRLASNCASSFSPPAWGWSGNPATRRVLHSVLPTRVGMVRQVSQITQASQRSPHPRGDGPHCHATCYNRVKFSPPARGWSEHWRTRPPLGTVLPTRVGMVREGGDPRARRDGSPHPRGDGPGFVAVAIIFIAFSPPAWGWSDSIVDLFGLKTVLPTRVGMVRQTRCRGCGWVGSPHPRGDGPPGALTEPQSPKFSPPAWGWSAVSVFSRGRFTVLPTRVGMVRACAAR